MTTEETVLNKALNERKANLFYSEQQKKAEAGRKKDLLKEHDELAADVFAAFTAMRKK